MSPQDVAAELARVLPHGPSQDRRSLLVAPPPDEDDSEAFPTVAHWGFTASFDQPRSGQLIEQKLGKEWRDKLLVAVFGIEGKSAVRLAADASYHQILITTPLVNLPEERFLYGEHLKHFFGEVTKALTGFADRFVTTTPLDEADARTRAIIGLVNGRNATVVGRVVAEKGRTYAGRDVFDVLLGLGFEWGDGDLFYWRPGGELLLTADTSSPPGFFPAREAAAGSLRVADVQFQFYLPHTRCAPLVLEAMVAAMKYTRSRLGGSLQGADGKPYDEDDDRRGIARLSQDLAEADFAPGSSAARATF